MSYCFSRWLKKKTIGDGDIGINDWYLLFGKLTKGIDRDFPLTNWQNEPVL